ncbi:MAG: hypothetical protein ACXV2J_14830 [Actinomycetes bacterium]|jgi:hypothetical protein
MTTSTRFTRERAPCGKTVDGERVLDDDEEGFVIDQLTYDCGCRSTRQQFHDGGVQLRVVDHHGKVRRDEHSAMHEG